MAANTPSRGPPESPPSPPMVWDGDKMFNVYIWDYCSKRGFKKTAEQLREEAGLEADSVPPINAKQGFLFEWWTVFWMLFGAKSNFRQDEDANLYANNHRAAADARPRGPPGQPVNRYMNGVQPRPAGTSIQNGVGANGFPTAPPMGPANGVQPPVGYPGMPVHANGAPGPSGAPGVPANQVNMQPLQPGQRPPPGSAPPQQRAPNGAAPFQSPTMAPSPHSQAPQPQGNPPPMSGLNPPQGPHRGPMAPPNGPGPGLPQRRTPQPGGQPLGRSPSQPGSPAPGGMIAQSPSMVARIPQGMQPGTGFNEEMLKNEMMLCPPAIISQAKQELQLAHKSPEQLTTEEKVKIVLNCRQKAQQQQGRSKQHMPGQPVQPGYAGPSNPMAGPSNPSMQPPMRTAQPGMQHQPPPGSMNYQQPHQQRPMKRSSSSPGQEPAQLPRNESSPPDRKRPRRSPPNGDPSQQQPPMTPLLPGQFPNQMSGGPPPPMGNGMMMTRQAIPSYPGQQSMLNMSGNPGMNMAVGPPLGGATSPGMMNQGQPMTPQMQQLRYKQTMVDLHKSTMPPMMPGGNAASPSAVDGAGAGYAQDNHQSRPGTAQFAPGGPGGMAGPNRMVQGKPMGPPPPPSPSLNIKKEGVDAGQNGSPHVAPGQAQTSGPQAQGAQHGPPTSNPMVNMLSASPVGMLSAPANLHQPSTQDPLTTLFNFENIDTSAFSDLDASFMDRADAPDFERDFGQWFNSDSINPLDTK